MISTLDFLDIRGTVADREGPVFRIGFISALPGGDNVAGSPYMSDESGVSARPLY